MRSFDSSQIGGEIARKHRLTFFMPQANISKCGAKLLTIVPVAMFIGLIAVLCETDGIGQNPMNNAAYRFMMRVLKPGVITASVALLLGCGLFSISISRRNALITGGVLATLSVLFGLTMSWFVSIHSWTAVFLLFWALACVAALIFLLAAVVRYVAHLVRTRPTVQ